ncbi:MAG: phage portal protein [Candidatus Absconditicoccaceae bacterium]
MFARLKNIFKKSESGFLTLFGGFGGDKVIKNHEYVNFFVGWQYAAITAISDSLSGLNWRIADKQDKEIKHEYSGFITPELLQNIAIFMKMTGTAYVWKVMNNRKVLGLSMLLPWNISPQIDSNGYLKNWIYREGSNQIILQPEEVMVFAEFNPSQRYPYITRGYSPIQAIAMTIRGEKEIEKWNYALLNHDTPPGMILITEQAMSKEQIEKVRASREARHSGADNAGKLAILPFGIKPANLQSSPKEMEFIAQQSRDRDKILAIYKVPKAVLGIGEGVNVGNVKAFNQVFASRCIEPLAKKIARVFNDQLFNGIGIFEFVNVLPTDEEEIRNHYFAGGITRNEYRQELGYKPIKGGDVFVDGTDAEIVQEAQKESIGISMKSVDFQTIVKGNIPWSEEWMQRRWVLKQKKNADYEQQLKVGFLKIFEQQKKDILKKFDQEHKKGLKKYNYQLLLKYYALYHILLRPTVEEIITQEGLRAMSELNVDIEFNPNTDKIKKELKQKIQLIAKNVDALTDEKIGKVVEMGLTGNMQPEEIKKELVKVFDELQGRRLETIVRTEAIRFGTYAEQSAREQSGVVKYKQWRTAIDERVCEHCGKMHGKKVALQEDFFKKGAIMTGNNGGKLKLEYENVIGSPLHPNCRCDMIPLIE